jgi:DNA-binding LacI/PurR family transcriptional regulator
MASIYDIAEKANISITTVSKILNGADDISEATRDRVIKIMKELNYTPKKYKRKQGALNLTKDSSTIQQIAFLTPDPRLESTNTPLMMETIQSLVEASEKIGANLIVCKIGQNNEMPACIKNKQVNAIIARCTNDDDIQKKIFNESKGIPLIWIHGFLSHEINQHIIRVSEESLILELINKSILEGAEQFVFINPNPSDHFHQLREIHMDRICKLKKVKYKIIRIKDYMNEEINEHTNEVLAFAKKERTAVIYFDIYPAMSEDAFDRWTNELSQSGANIIKMKPGYTESPEHIRIPIKELGKHCVDYIQELSQNPQKESCTMLIPFTRHVG